MRWMSWVLGSTVIALTAGCGDEDRDLNQLNDAAPGVGQLLRL